MFKIERKNYSNKSWHHHTPEIQGESIDYSTAQTHKHMYICAQYFAISLKAPWRGGGGEPSSAGDGSLRVNYPALNLRSPLVSPPCLPSSSAPLIGPLSG